MIEIRTTPNPPRTRLVSAVISSLDKALRVDQLPAFTGIYAIPGMSGKKYRYFINTLVGSLGDTAYLEVGSWAGSTLCSAIYGNKVRAAAIDNWSTFNGPRDAFNRNLEAFATNDTRVTVHEGDFRSIDYSKIGKFEIYLFDGPHGQKDQYDGLNLVRPALKKEFVFIVDDWNWLAVRLGTFKAIQDCRIETLYAAEIRTTLNNSHASVANQQSDWHNGYFISVLKQHK